MHGEDRLRARWHGQGPHRLPRHWTGRALRAHQVLQHVQDLQERQGLPQDQVLSS